MCIRDSPSTENISLTASWVIIAAMGAGAGQHFLQDRAAIHSRLESEGAEAAIKHGGSIKLWDTIETLKEKAAELPVSEVQDYPVLLQEVLDLYKSIDPEALDDDLRVYISELLRQSVDPEARTLGM